MAANLEQAGTAIGGLNSTMQGIVQSQSAMGSTLLSLTNQFNELTGQLKHILSQKADTPTTTNDEIDEPCPKKGKPTTEASTNDNDVL